MIEHKNIENSNLRELALFLLINNQNSDKKLSDQLNSFFKKTVLPDPRNFHFISEIVTGVYKRIITLDFILEFLIKKDFKKLPPVILNILRTGLYQLLYMDSVPDSAAINESVKLVKKYGHQGTVKLTNAVLRNSVRKKAEIEAYIKSLPVKQQISINYSLPQWLTDYWLSAYSADFVMEMSISLQNSPPLFLRINTLKTGVAEFKAKLAESGISFTETIYNEVIKLTENISLKELFGYEQGLWYIQDQGAAIVSRVLAPEKDSFIIDFCAFPGGKTSHISQLMGNTGEILVIDSSKNREEKFIENITRLGNTNIKTLIQSATEPLPLNRKADKILVDPPCSGLGVIRRKPEIKYRNKFEDIKRLAELQSEILKNAAQYLKVGGELIYSTCTISKKENEDVVERFLAENKCFRKKKLKLFPDQNQSQETLPVDLLNDEKDYLYLYTHLHGTDGFFIAGLEKFE